MDKVEIHHVIPEQFPPFILSSAPCTEYATFYECEPSFIKNVENFAKQIDDGKPKGFQGLAYGEVIEEIKKNEGDKEAKAVVIWM